ncbi:Uncharacterised protein [Vibrio cholerae]|nr:Uncharacterised protein [Vibrio cholerae]
MAAITAAIDIYVAIFSRCHSPLSLRLTIIAAGAQNLPLVVKFCLGC